MLSIVCDSVVSTSGSRSRAAAANPFGYTSPATDTVTTSMPAPRMRS